MILIMDKKQKEALIVALAEKGATYREITKRAGVSPNTIKAVLNRAGLDETTSISSRDFRALCPAKDAVRCSYSIKSRSRRCNKILQRIPDASGNY